MRIRSAAVAILDGRLLVVSRQKAGRHYLVLPGGGVEDGETLRAACRRELLEETGLRGEIGEFIDVPVDPHAPVAYFAVAVDSRAVSLGGPELDRMSPRNRYEPTWVPVEALGTIPLVPTSAVLAVETYLRRRR
ncbi:NUDIX domain-containing protein [Diaminobutyricimonas aerilata]|uniref:NUDIX domain-containing protein n=1 Tax=Diaminobutyricimonas aerilata TaxID=1162967 RepID=UPI002481C683|nr:NUDIX domain-containing protein [Diaminobutyricimonas aerilata]